MDLRIISLQSRSGTDLVDLWAVSSGGECMIREDVRVNCPEGAKWTHVPTDTKVFIFIRFYWTIIFVLCTCVCTRFNLFVLAKTDGFGRSARTEEHSYVTVSPLTNPQVLNFYIT